MKKNHPIISRFKSIRLTMLVSYFVLIGIALSIFAVVSLRYTENTVLSNSTEYAIQLVSQVNNDIDSYVNYLQNISVLISSNEDVLYYLFDENQTAADEIARMERVKTQLRTIMDTREDIANIGIIGENGKHIINRGGAVINRNVDVSQVDWVRRAYEAREVTCLSPSHVQNVVAGSYEWVVTMSRGLQRIDNHEVEGVFFVDLNYSSISELCDNISMGSRGYVFILDENGKIIYHPQQQLLYSGLKTEKIEDVMSCKEDYLLTREGHDSKLYTISRSENTGWIVVGVAYTEELLKNSAETRNIYWGSALVLLLAALGFAILLSNEITKPIKALGDSMKEVERGNFDNAMLTVEGDNELGRLSRNFNIMTTKIQHLMEQNVEEQRQKRKSELSALQAQINPHFLYNTLDSIIWMAEWGKNQDVVLMTSALARLLRQSISNQNELVTVEEETEYTRSYLVIQKMRYKDKLEYDIFVEPSVQKCRITKLILQPLVENAIYHGIKYKEGKGTIRIRGWEADDEIHLQVQDDGIGMTEEQLSKIFEKRKTDRKHNGVGVHNVHQRIQLYYGKEYGLIFRSRLNEGTTVEIHIPCGIGGSDEAAK